MKKKILFVFKDTLICITLLSFIGLIQQIVYYIVCFYSHNLTFSLSHLLENGSLTVFSLTMVASIFVDIHFYNKYSSASDKKFYKDSVFIFLPWALVLLTAILTTIKVLQSKLIYITIDKDHIALTEKFVVFLSYLYAAYYKYNHLLFQASERIEDV